MNIKIIIIKVSLNKQKLYTRYNRTFTTKKKINNKTI